ncbi:MAG TPA: hypothetical protein VN578_13820 [Candidatus Binatia bacterium]|jgi:hypothetical protein|nr:hypothetical protein [Candidatus Binatia bacterium]
MDTPNSASASCSPRSEPPHPEQPSNPQIEILPHPVAPPPGSNGSAVAQPAPSLPPVLRKLTRNGKIARLPKSARDMVNRMLFNHIPDNQIASALSDIGFTVTPRNVSNWKTRGGFKEWCLEQEHALQFRLLQDNLTDYLRQHDASQVPEVGLQLAATHLVQFLLRPEAAQQLTTQPEKYCRTLASLCRLSGQIQALQKYRDDSAKELGQSHYPERVKREEEKDIEIVRETYSSTIGESPRDPNIPYRNYLPKPD